MIDTQASDFHLGQELLCPDQKVSKAIIPKIKQLYRHKIFQKALQYTSRIDKFYKEFNTKDCLTILDETWISITENYI